MPKIIAQKKAEEKKKKSSASSAYEQAKQQYEQQKKQDVHEAERQALILNTQAKTGVDSQTYLSGLEQYKQRLSQLGMNYGYDVGENIRGVDEAINSVRRSQIGRGALYGASIAPTKGELMASGGKGGKVGKKTPGGRVNAVAETIKQNTLTSTKFSMDDAAGMNGVYNPTAEQRTRIGNVLAAGGKGWTSGQASALGFLLDPTDDGSMTDAEMMFGTRSAARGMEGRAAQWLNEKRAKATQSLYGTADDLLAQSLASETLAKKGLGTLGQIGVDMGVTGTQMLLDAAIGRLTGMGMSSMGTRTFGQSAREALANGATQQQAFNYGMNAALVEVGTEKMFDVMKIFGGGAADDVMESVIRGMAKTDLGRTALRIAGGFSGEAIEELVSGVINPLIRSGYDPKALKDYASSEYWKETLYEGLVGGLLGLVGGGGQVLTGRNARANQILRQQDAVAEYAKKFGGTAKAVETVYRMNTETAPEDFQRGFEAAYYMGREGVAVDQAMNAESTSTLTPAQRQSAWEIGRDARETGAEPVKLETMEGGANNGTAMDLRHGGERNSLPDSGGQVRQVARGAGSEVEGPRIAENAKDADVQSVKTRRENVVIPGMREQDLLVPEEKSYTPEMKKAMKNAAKDGVKLHFFMGDYLKRYDGDGTVHYSRGVSDSNGNVWVRADDPNYTASQIARHEGGHDLIARGVIDLDDAREKIVQTLGEEAYRQALDDYRDAYDGADMTDEEVFEEIVCDARGGMNIFEGAGVRYDEAAKRIVPMQQAAREGIRERSGKETRGPPAEASAETTQKMAEMGIAYDAETESFYPDDSLKLSRLTHSQSEYVQARDETAARMSEEMGIDVDEAKKYIDDVNSIMYMIADDKGRLDYEDTGLSPLITNAEYGVTFDTTTLCQKRRLITGTFSAIQNALPNTALTAEEVLEIRKMMDDAGLEVNCGKCYVEGSRANMGKFTKAFLSLYAKYHPGKYVPNMAEMNTPDGIEWVRQNHYEVYEEYERFWNNHGKLREGDPNLFASQQKPKLYRMRSAYKGEILKQFRDPEEVKKKNENGGLRFQSYSDLETVHILDVMQGILDASRVGLQGQGYCKVQNFARCFGNTGLKINLSIDAWDVDENGKLIFNNKEGMPVEDAFKLREQFSKNVGTICCVYDDKQLLAALADPRIDFIIPFHRSQWKKAQYKAMGLPATTKDYTYQQNEKWLKPAEHTHEWRGRQVKTKCTNYMPNQWWDPNLDGKGNAEKYLQMCARDGKRPKFYKFLVNNGDGSYSLQPDGSTDGYWKLLIDFKMYDNDGNFAPQEPMKPIFEMDAIREILTGYEGGHNRFPVAQGIVDEFVSKYKAEHKGQKFSDVLPALGNDYKVYNRRALISDETMDYWLSGNGFASTNPNYAQAYITYMSPNQFLRLTTNPNNPEEIDRIWQRSFDKTPESTVEQSKRQPIHLTIDHETGKVYGHEGRHRMFALERAGVREVPVMLFDSSNKYSKEPMDSLVLWGQFDDETHLSVRDLLPFSNGYADELRAKYSTESEAENNEKETLRFSSDLATEQLARENKALQREVTDLQKQVRKWKNETKRTERVSMREDDVRREAKDITKALNSKADVDSITARLQELGEYMMNGEPDGGGVSYETVREMATEIAEDIVGAEQVNIRGDVFDEYQHLANLLKGKWLHISERAAADLLAETGYESIGQFNDAHKGVVRITTKPALGKDRTVQDAYYEMIEAMPGWFPENVAESEFLPRMLEVLDGLRPVYGMSDETSAHYNEAVTWAANDIIDRMLDESVRQNPKTFADRAQAKYDKERARLYQRIRRVREQGNERVERTKREYAERSRKAVERLTARQEREIQKLKDRQKEVRKNERERRDTTAIWHKIQKLGAKFRQMAEHPAQAASKHAPRELAKALQGIADVFYTDNRQRSMDTINAAIQNLRTTFAALENDPNYGIYYDEQLAEINDQVEQTLKDVPAREMEPLEAEMVYRLLRAHMHNITNANKFVTGQWAKGIWETGRDWSAEVDGASPVMKGWIGDFLNWQLRPDSFFRRISGFAKNSVGERVQKMFADGTEKMLRIQQDAYYHFRKYTESKDFDKLSKRGKKDLVDVGLKDENGRPVLLTRDMMLAVYMHLSSEQNLEAATYGGFDVPALNEYYTGKTARSYDRSTRTMNVGSETRELQNELHDLEKALNSGELSDEEAQDATARIEALEQEIRDRADAFVGQMLKVRENISKMLTQYEKDFVDAAHAWMKKSADYINAETLAMYGIEKAQVENYWPMHRNLNFVNTDMRTVTDEINLENWGSLKERVRSSAPLKLTGFGFEIDNHTKKMSQFCGYAAAQRDFNKLYNTKLTREGSSLSEKIQRKFGSEERKMGATGQQYIDAYIAAVSGADKSDATFFSVIRRNLPRATLTLNLRVAVSQLASMPTAAAEVGWGSAMKGLPKGLATAFNPKAKAKLAEQDPWFWQRYRGEGGMREFADMKEERNWLDRFYNRTAALPVIRRMVNWCQDFDVFATASMWAMSESWVKDHTDLKPGTQEFNDAVSAKYADVIRKTQPNYTVTERSGLLRDKREGYKILTMYKTQSNQNLNILYDANATLMKYKKDFKAGKNGVKKADVQEAEKQFARAYTAVLLGGSVTFAILRAGANAILHAVNRYRDDDDELTMMSVLKGISEETMSAIAGMFAFGSAVYDIVHALVTGDKYYGLNESAIEALTGLAEQAEKVLSKALDRDKDVELEDVEKLVTKACNILGIPWNNGKTIVTGIVNHVRDAQNGEFLSFRAGVQHTAKKEANKIIDGYKAGAGDKVKRAWDDLLKLKDGDEAKAQETVRGGIKGAYLAGDVTDKQALDLLKRYGGKDGDDAKELVLTWQCEKDTGIAYGDLKQAFIDGEISEKKAVEYKQKYGGMDADKAQEAVTGWRAEKDTGVAMGDIKEAYLDDDLSKADVISMKMKYDGKTQEEAEEYAMKLECEKYYGVEYGIRSVQDALIDGDITEAEAREIWKKYGGKDDEYIDRKLSQVRFAKEYPGVNLDLVNDTSTEAFYKYGEPAEIPADKFMEYWNKMSEYTADYDAAGNLISGSKKQKVVNYIASLSISDAKKDALYFSQGYSAKNKPAWP